MAGLYIHIPFCKSRCIYCAFYSTTDSALRQRYVEAVIKEMATHPCPSSLEGGSIETIYLGGGTPSQLTIPQLQQLFYNIYKVYKLPSLREGKGVGLYAPSLLGGSGLEVTIECNPDDVTPEWAAALAPLGINRVSMGAQTFDDSRLRFLHRRHTAAQVEQAVRTLRAAGIRNISIDLMYGFPGETLEDWQRDIDAALALGVEHLSAYCLMVEEGTVLYEKMRDGENEKMRNGENEEMINDKAEETERAMYELLIDRLTSAGYEHYEISNFALRPAAVPADQPSPYRSRHNSNYWNDTPYIGLGAAAHSYTPAAPSLSGSPAESVAIRSWNVSDLRQYIEAIEHGERPCEEEVLDEDTRYNDRITVALRTSDGLDLTTLSERHLHYCMKEAHRFLSDGLLTLRGQHLVLTRRGLFVSDMVMRALMMV
jgi:oxygen-independent coproporphyrinogen-3 oxidase